MNTTSFHKTKKSFLAAVKKGDDLELGGMSKDFSHYTGAVEVFSHPYRDHYWHAMVSLVNGKAVKVV